MARFERTDAAYAVGEREVVSTTEWEYGVGLSPSPGFIYPWPKLVDAQRMASMNHDRDATYFRRRKAGPWLPVPGSTVRESDSGVRDSDSEESEGKA